MSMLKFFKKLVATKQSTQQVAVPTVPDGRYYCSRCGAVDKRIFPCEVCGCEYPPHTTGGW